MMSNPETKLDDRSRAARPLTLAKLPFKVAVAVMAVIALPLAAYLVYDAYQSFNLNVAEVENKILQEKKDFITNNGRGCSIRHQFSAISGRAEPQTHPHGEGV